METIHHACDVGRVAVEALRQLAHGHRVIQLEDEPTAVRRCRRVLAIATTQGRDLLRRRLALVILASLPALFYLSAAGQHISKGHDPWNLNVAVIGVAWAVGGAVRGPVDGRRGPR